MRDRAIRVAVADDESLIAASLATLLGLEDDVEVVATCGSGEELLEWLDRGEADVCVVDLMMGGIDGIETARRIRRRQPDAGVLVVTSHGRPAQLKRALAAGVGGFLPKTATAAEFAAAVRVVRAGRRHLDPDLAAAAITAGESPLTEREAEVLEVAGAGGSVADIARAVHLAEGTTRNYLSSAMGKVGARNRHEAHHRAVELGWI